MPANPVWQYTLYFLHNLTGEGWEELIAWTGSGLSVFDDPLTWAQQRRTFLAQDCSIIGWARRRIDGTKDSISYLLTNPVKGQYGEAAGIGTGKTNEPSNTIEYESYTTNRANRRCFYFRGIDDSLISAGSLTGAGDNAKPLIEAYLQWISTGQGGVRINANPWLSIQAIGNNPVGQAGAPIQVTAVGIGMINDNTVFQLRGLRGYPYLNGRWVGYGLSVNNVSLGTSSGRYTMQLVGTGYIRVLLPDVKAISNWFFARCGNRKTGLPFGVLRGKKSKKVIHRG